jgi:hypothetical protein
MHTWLFALFVLAISANAAEARHWHHHWRASGFDLNEIGEDELKPVLPDVGRSGRGRRTVASLVPPDWRAEDQNGWDGKRFISPDGASWIAIYKASAKEETPADHMKEIIFAPSETITNLRGERTWIAVSGLKDTKIFYRKAILACAGTAWHHIAVEYPVELKDRMDRFVALASRTLDDTQNDCGGSAVNR